MSVQWNNQFTLLLREIVVAQGEVPVTQGVDHWNTYVLRLLEQIRDSAGGGGASGDHNIITRTVTTAITIATDTSQLFRDPLVTTGSITIVGTGEMFVL